MEKCKKCKATVSSKLIFKLLERKKNFSCRIVKQHEFTDKERLIGGIIEFDSLSSLIMNLPELEIVSKSTQWIISMIFVCIALEC
jgi:hypothetical protein